MFGFPLFIFAGILSFMTITTAQERVWRCSFGTFGTSKEPEPCTICKEEGDVYWFVTKHHQDFGEPQPYFRASLNNNGLQEGSKAECTILTFTLKGPNSGILSFKYLFNSTSTTGRYGYFNYSVCKDEGTVHQLHIVDGWAYKEIPFNCSEVEIAFKAVRGDSYADVGIDNVTVIEDLLADWYCTFEYNTCNLTTNGWTLERNSKDGGYIAAHFNPEMQPRLYFNQMMSSRRVRISFLWYYQDSNSDITEDRLEVSVCGSNGYRIGDSGPNRWLTENINCTCDSNNISITFVAKGLSNSSSVFMDYLRIYELSDVSGLSTPSSADMPTVPATTPTVELSTTRETKPLADNSSQVIVIASSVIAVCLLCVIIIFLVRRRCRSTPKHSSSEGSDDTEGDTGLVINELYGARGDSPPASDTLVGDKIISSVTSADALYTNVDNDFEGNAGGRSGDSAGRSTACDGNTYFTLEAPTKDGSTHYSSATNADALYTNVDNNFEGIAGGRSGDSAGRSTACDGNTYFTLEAPAKDGSAHYQASGDEYEDIQDERFCNGAKACGSMSDKTACNANTYGNLEF